MKKANAKQRAVFLMLICASLWSIAGIFIKMIPWHGLVIAGMRSLLAAGCVAIYMCMCKQRPRLNKFSVISSITMSLVFLSFVCANKLTTAANAIVLQFTAPVFILILSALVFHQRFSRADVITVVLTMIGISLFFFDKLAPGNLAGNLLAVFAGFSMSIMFITAGRADEESRMSGILFGHLITAAVGIPFMFVYDTPFTTPAVISIIVLGIVQLGIPYVLYGIAIRDCPPLACSLLGAVEPLLNPVWVFIFDGERPGIFALCGAAIVIVTITCWCILRDRKVAQTTSA